MDRKFFWLCSGLFALLLQGCTVIDVYEGQVNVQRHFGLLYEVDFSPGKHSVYMERRGIGLITGADSVSLGYVAETWLGTAGDDCTIILIKPTRESTQALLAALQTAGQSPASLCITPDQKELP